MATVDNLLCDAWDVISEAQDKLNEAKDKAKTDDMAIAIDKALELLDNAISEIAEARNL